MCASLAGETFRVTIFEGWLMVDGLSFLGFARAILHCNSGQCGVSLSSKLWVQSASGREAQPISVWNLWQTNYSPEDCYVVSLYVPKNIV